MKQNKKITSVEVLNEYLDQCIRPVADCILSLFDELYNVSQDDRVHDDECALSDLLMYAESVIENYETLKK